ncbi:MAG: hypothetical protein BGO12_12395 [Verrucomicrobia bacterium 61-8]|nr:MAG: hypothetical protein BGO12_12395 [Verrucomicrobia bacterium 61-8]
MMPLSNSSAEIHIPGGQFHLASSLRVNYLGIAAHQDDLEFMALQGILPGLANREASFGGVICTDGSGSPRSGKYAGTTDPEMATIRRREQRLAADIGQYRFVAQLGYSSKELRDGGSPIKEDLASLCIAAQPRIVYTHNPLDKHDTHLHVLANVIETLRSLPAEIRPEQLYGCEVWRGLDWVNDEEKVAFDVSGSPHIANALNGIFDSQIAGGKRYDLATDGRRRANATYAASHETDGATHLALAVDLSALLKNPRLDPVDFALGFIDRFRESAAAGLRRAFRS